MISSCPVARTLRLRRTLSYMVLTISIARQAWCAHSTVLSAGAPSASTTCSRQGRSKSHAQAMWAWTLSTSTTKVVIAFIISNTTCPTRLTSRVRTQKVPQAHRLPQIAQTTSPIGAASMNLSKWSSSSRVRICGRIFASRTSPVATARRS